MQTLNTPIKRTTLAVLLVAQLMATTAVQADERESLEQLRATTTNLIELLVQEGVLSKQKADALIQKATADAKQYSKQAEMEDNVKSEVNKAMDEKTVRVQYIPQHVKQAMREEIEHDVMEKLNYKAGERLGVPEWIDRISFHGDIRLRGQLDEFPGDNADYVLLNDVLRDMNLENSTEERRRARIRARLAADVKINDWLTGGLQFVTGQQTTPVTPNQTEGISQGKYLFTLDRAFLQAKLNDWATVTGGRFANPFMFTDLMWDPDLAFDGFTASFTPKINERLSSFTTVGAFPLEEVESSSTNKASDKWLYSVQTGIKWTADNKSSVKVAAAYHDFKNVEGRLNTAGLHDYDGTAPEWRQRGNNTFDINANNLATTGEQTIIGLASKFELVNLIAQVDLMNFDPVHVTFTGDYVRNIGFDQQEILKRTGNLYKKENEGYNFRIDVGNNGFLGPYVQNVMPREWQVSLGYKYLEADAVLDGFTDSNFRLGGTNAKGWYVFGNYAIDKNAWISARYMSADSISSPLNQPARNYSVDVLLIDLNARF
jgi:polyhydroxyalkanoate synthesis regulator phasin